MSKKHLISRRRFLGTAGVAAAACTIVPRHVWGANDKLNLAFVAVGGRAGANLGGCSSQNICVLCEVDKGRMGDAPKKWPNAKIYQDWREMLDKEAKGIDAVVCSTPDHCHAIVSITAMKMGKHVYCEKPVCRTVSEARLIKEAAKKHGVCTQMGNTGHASDGARLTNEWVQSGSIGDVKLVHCCTDRPAGWWPQGIRRPKEDPVPASMNWDIWLGPAPKKPYSKEIAPFKWRGYWDYGAGALGDMGAHIIDHPMWALDLGDPLTVVAEYVLKDPESIKDTLPAATKVTYEFPAKGNRPPVTLVWYDGGKSNQPPRPEGLEKDRQMIDNGVIYYGSKFNMWHGSHGGAPRIIPEAKMKEFQVPPKTLPRSNGGHYGEWFNAIKAKDPTMAKSNFDYATHLTEVMLLGCVAVRVGSGVKLKWDAEKMKFDNEAANKYLQHEYREGWAL
jgi:predicted dehydrogenase